MQTKIQQVEVFGKLSKFEYTEYWESDKEKWRQLFKAWALTNNLLKFFWARWLNLHEWISETAFCIATWAVRFKSIDGAEHASFDTFDLKTNRTQQIKASSIEEDCTSFWPESVRDDLYFMDFYNGGNLDWHFDIYYIPSDQIYGLVLNSKKNETFKDQQNQWRRPRFSIMKSIIKPNKLKPIMAHVTI